MTESVVHRLRRAQATGTRFSPRNPWIMEVSHSLSPELCDDIAAAFDADGRKQNEELQLCNLQGWEATDAILCSAAREGIKTYREHLCDHSLPVWPECVTVHDRGYTVQRLAKQKDVPDWSHDNKISNGRVPPHFTFVWFLKGRCTIELCTGDFVAPTPGKLVIFPAHFTFSYRHHTEDTKATVCTGVLTVSQ